jgi:hypothetical protein
MAVNRAHMYIDEIEQLEQSAKVRPAPPLPRAGTLAVASSPPVPTKAPRTDLEVLDAIMSAPERLTTVESKAFGDMRRRMASRLLYALSYAQRSWAQEVAARLGFDVVAPDRDGWRETAADIRVARR